MRKNMSNLDIIVTEMLTLILKVSYILNTELAAAKIDALAFKVA
jgi:hypothetical protein